MPKYTRVSKFLAAAHIFTNFGENSKILSRLLSVLSLSRKFVHDHCCCPKSAITLTVSKMEAILDLWRGCQNLSKIQWQGRGVRGRKWRAGQLPFLSHLKGERGGGGREGEERTCPCTKCTHMHVVFPPSLFPVSPFCCRSLSRYEKSSTGTIQRWIHHYKEKSFFVSMPENLAWTQQQVDSTVCHPHQPSCGVRSSWEGREILAISALPFSILCDKPPLLPSRAISRTRSNPAHLPPQRRHEAIRVSYTTFIVNEAVVNRKIAVET